MVTVKTKATPMFSVPNPVIAGWKLTAVDSATIMNNNMFVLKSRSDSFELKPICIYKIADFATSTDPKQTLIKIKNSAGKELTALSRHCNSITWAPNEGSTTGPFFIATMNLADEPQVLQVSLSGVLKKEILYKKEGKNTRMFNLSYVGMENGYRKFICGVGMKSSRYRYDFALLKGSTLEYTGVSFSGTNEIEKWTHNDITYYNGKLFTTHFKVDDKGVIAYNRIYVYKVPTSLSGTGNILEPTKCIISNKPKAYDKKFEIEAFCPRNGSWYGSYNCESSDVANHKDFVFKLTKKI